MNGLSPIVYVVIPVHNRRELTHACLESLSQQTYPYLSIIVVDDGSTDGTSEMIREKYPEVTLLHGDGNLWWTAATNMGIRKALETASDDDYILVINDDLEVNPDYVDNLVRFARRHPRSLVGSVTVDFDNPDMIDSGGVRINWWTAKCRPMNRGRRLSEFDPDYYIEASYLTGRGTLIPVEVFNDLGLYDEKHLPHYGGDIELPVRAAKKGYRLFVTYRAVVRSHVEATGQMNRQDTYKLSDLQDYYFSIRSNARLKDRFHFARKVSGRNPFRFVSYLLFDLARISYHFFRRLSY